MAIYSYPSTKPLGSPPFFSHLVAIDTYMLPWVYLPTRMNGVAIRTRVVEGFPWCRKIVDDILLWASTPIELEECLHAVLQRCEHLHVTLSRSKFQIASRLNFAGCIVSGEGAQPDPDFFTD